MTEIDGPMELIVYLASSVLVLVIAFVVFRVLVRREYLRRGRLSPFGSFLQYVAIGAWAYHGYIYRPLDWPAIHMNLAFRIIGWILFAGGVALTLFILVALGVRRSHGREVSGLRQSGFYRLTRNPQVVAFLVAMVGYGILWPTWQHLGSFVLVVAITHMMVLTEEDHLRDVFGEEYEHYRLRVPRYLGLGGKER